MKRFAKVLTMMFVLLIAVSAWGQTYSSLVIDARDIKLTRSMSPKILNEMGLEIYGTILKEADIEKVMEIGVVGYVDSLDTAKKHLSSRLGNNPFIIKAKGAIGNTASNVVITNADAAKILELNKTSHFLTKFNVIILISPDNE